MAGDMKHGPAPVKAAAARQRGLGALFAAVRWVTPAVSRDAAL
jgi:hypothetical protein